MSNENDTKQNIFSQIMAKKHKKRKLNACEIFIRYLWLHIHKYNFCIYYITNSHTIFIAHFHHTIDDLLSIFIAH